MSDKTVCFDSVLFLHDCIRRLTCYLHGILKGALSQAEVGIKGAAMEWLFHRGTATDDEDEQRRVGSELAAIISEQGTRLTRSFSLPINLVEQEEQEAVVATFEAQLAADHFRQCRCPEGHLHSEGFIFQLMNSPCIVCGLLAVVAFVSGRPVHDEADAGPSSRYICDSHDQHETHHWWHHIGKSDPEIHMDSLQLIVHWGYPGEEHSVTTQDGYILRLHRIPAGRHQRKKVGERKPVAFLQHGLEGSSADWITNYPKDSLGFILADAGFDVWMGNFRGNQYSLRHRVHSVDSTEFWDFSWDQMAEFDLPAMIGFVLEETKEKQLHYVAHSQGSLTMFARLSEDPTLGHKLKSMTALAPVITLRHIRGFLKYMAVFTSPVNRFTQIFGMKAFLPNNWVSKLLAKTVCEWKGTNAICSNVVFAISGPNTKQLNETRLPVYLAHIPSGTSAQNIAHFGQLVNSGRCQKFDHGSPQANVKRYGLPFPPTYNLGRIRVPTFVFWGKEDWLSNEADLRTSLFPHLLDLRGLVALPGFNHLDFIWGLKAADQIYRPTLRLLLDMETQTTTHSFSSTSTSTELPPSVTVPTFQLDSTSDYDTADMTDA